MQNNSALTQVTQFIHQAVHETLKQPNGCLKRPYIIPGGPYARDLWDWDSYWTLYAICGLFHRLGVQEELEKIREYARGTLFNFLDEQGEDGSLPILITAESRDFFDCVHHPENNMAKPFIGQLAKLLWENKMISREELADSLTRIVRFHQCYDNRYQDKRTGLVFWAKDWGIGMDDDPTAWGRPPKSCGSVFLNAFLLRDCQATREMAAVCGMNSLVAECDSRIERLSHAIETYCWDEREKAYFSVDLQCRRRMAKLPLIKLNVNLNAFWHCLKLKVLTWYTILPFWLGLGTQEQLDACLKENFTPERLRSKFGVRAISKDESMYQPEIARGNPSNWLGPIWLLPNYIVWDTLRSRGHRKEANQLSSDVLGMLARDLEDENCFHEYYSPESGLGVNGPKFMSWNALAAMMTDKFTS